MLNQLDYKNALDVLRSFPRDSLVAEFYDDDKEFSGALGQIFGDAFEYPDFSGRKLSLVVKLAAKEIAALGMATGVGDPSVAADEDPAYWAQINGLKSMTAAINAGYELKKSPRPLDELYQLWGELGLVASNSRGELQENFLDFPEGTHQQEIFRWFEAQNPRFSVSQLQSGILPEPQELSSSEFSKIAQIIKLENHGRQWDVHYSGKSIGFGDGESKDAALKEVHRLVVNNAIYAHSPEASTSFDCPAFPPAHVVAEYPELKVKFADVFSAQGLNVANHSPATENPTFRAQVEGPKTMTASVNAGNAEKIENFRGMDALMPLEIVPKGGLLSHGWSLTDEYTKDLFPGAMFMRQVGGKGTPFASYDFTIVQSDSQHWIPVHGSVKKPAVDSPEEAAQVLAEYWHDLPNEQKLMHVSSRSPEFAKARDHAETHRLEILTGHSPRFDTATLAQVLTDLDEGKLQQDAGKAPMLAPSFEVGQRFDFKPGEAIVGNGYRGTVAKVLDGQLAGMVEVRLPGGIACVSASFPDCFPAITDGVEVVTQGQFIGSVKEVTGQFVVQDAGRGRLVAHECHRFEKLPAVGDVVDLQHRGDKVAFVVEQAKGRGNER